MIVLIGSHNVDRSNESIDILPKQGLSVELLFNDVACEISVPESTSVVKSKYGRLDILVNNAGIALESEDNTNSF